MNTGTKNIIDRTGDVVNRYGVRAVRISDRRALTTSGSTRLWESDDGNLYYKTSNWTRVKEEYLAPQELAYLVPVWNGILKRCYDPSRDSYASYGARGITVTASWRPGHRPTFGGGVMERMGAFLRFCGDIIEHLGHRPADDYQIDRLDPEGHYVIQNMEWVSPQENARRRRMTGGRAGELFRVAAKETSS